MTPRVARRIVVAAAFLLVLSACDDSRAVVAILIPQTDPAYRIALSDAWRTEALAAARHGGRHAMLLSTMNPSARWDTTALCAVIVSSRYQGTRTLASELVRSGYAVLVIDRPALPGTMNLSRAGDPATALRTAVEVLDVALRRAWWKGADRAELRSVLRRGKLRTTLGTVAFTPTGEAIITPEVYGRGYVAR